MVIVLIPTFTFSIFWDFFGDVGELVKGGWELYKVLPVTCVGDDKGEVEEFTVIGLAGLVLSELSVITITGDS